MLIEEGKFYFKVYLADYCQLTNRGLTRGAWNRRYYEPNFIVSPKFSGKRRKGIQTQYPKWSRFAFRANRYQCENQDSVRVYNSPIWLFAIQERNTKQILHACIRKDPDISKYSHFPTFFNVKQCLKDTFSRYGLPYGFISDGQVIRNNKEELKGIEAIVRAENPRYVASLESFFARIQYEMRGDLNHENLNRYVEFWNQIIKKG